MKRILLATVAVAALATSALAADIPRRGPAPAPYTPPIYTFTWTGFYIGGQVGYGWGDNRISETGVAGASVKNSLDGFLGGVHVGANWQINQFVLGLEGDIEYSGLNGRRGVGAPFTVATAFDTEFNWQGSIRGRAGFAFDRALLYVTGGFAFADFDRKYFVPALTTISETKSGYTIGGGIEYAFTNNWTARGEYRYSDFGKVSDTVGGVAYRNNVDQHTVRLGVSYKW